MSPQPIEHDATNGDKTPLWTDPKNLPAAVEGIYKAAFYLSTVMQKFDELSPIEFGDAVFQLKNYHAEMDASRAGASNDCETLAEALTASLGIYRGTDFDGGAAVSAQGG